MITERVERITFFGDLRKVRVSYLNTFVKTTGNLCGGAFPNKEIGAADEEVIKKTQLLLTEVGISNSLPIVLCNSTEERAEKIMQRYSAQTQNGGGRYWIIENDPISLVQAFASILKNKELQDAVLNTTTVINPSSAATFDYVDKVTGLRVVSLAPMYGSYPMHPVPSQNYLSY